MIFLAWTSGILQECASDRSAMQCIHCSVSCLIHCASSCPCCRVLPDQLQALLLSRRLAVQLLRPAAPGQCPLHTACWLGQLQAGVDVEGLRRPASGLLSGRLRAVQVLTLQ